MAVKQLSNFRYQRSGFASIFKFLAEEISRATLAFDVRKVINSVIIDSFSFKKQFLFDIIMFPVDFTIILLASRKLSMSKKINNKL